jgi:hypothetical protein
LKRLRNNSKKIQEKISFNFNDSIENFIKINEILLNFLKMQILIYQNNYENCIINIQNVLNIKNIQINDINNLNSKFIEEIENAENFENFSNKFFNSNNYVFKNNNNDFNNNNVKIVQKKSKENIENNLNLNENLNEFQMKKIPENI